jgi:hypothetical protein
MPTKAETKSIKAEIRGLKSTLTARRKSTLRAISADRKIVRDATRRITHHESDLGQYDKDVNHRIAVLEGRLSS